MFLLRQQSSLQSVVAQLLLKRKANNIEDLIARDESPGVSRPRFIRVNALKMDVHTAINVLGEKYAVQKNDMVPNLLVLPPGSDLHDHPLVANGSIFMQGKGSSMVAVALDPKPGWEVRSSHLYLPSKFIFRSLFVFSMPPFLSLLVSSLSLLDYFSIWLCM